MSDDVRNYKIEHESGIRYSRLNKEVKENAESNSYEGQERKTSLLGKFKKLSIAKKTSIISLTVLLTLILLVVIFVFSKLAKINFVRDSDYERSSASADENGVLVIGEDEKTGKNLDKDAIQNLNSKLAKNLPDNILFDENVLNILLIGVDSREAEEQSLSDSMILASIDFKHKKIHLNSLLRDTYVYIPDYGYSKLNAANALGGPPLLLKTIEYNYRVAVKHFVLVDMFSLAEIIDTIGGVEIDVKYYEIDAVNEALAYYNTLINEPKNSGFLKYPGKQLLNGKQALNYGRIRNVGNSDYERTERQRRILKSIFNGAKKASLGQINEMVDKVFPLVTTNLGSGDIFTLLQNTQGLLKSEIVSGHIPVLGTFEETYIQGMACLVPDLVSNIKYLAETVYRMSDADIDKLFEDTMDADEIQITTETLSSIYQSAETHVTETQVTETQVAETQTRTENGSYHETAMPEMPETLRATASSRQELSYKPTTKGTRATTTQVPTSPSTTSTTVTIETEPESEPELEPTLTETTVLDGNIYE